MLFEIKNVSKVYKLENKEEKFALNNICLSFDKTGLVCILGKSGSGKSTLLNMIAQFDTPSFGKVLFKNKDINKFKDKKKEEYRKSHIGVIFQHYHLLEDETALFNVSLPALINGMAKNKAIEKAKSLFRGIHFKEELIGQKCSKLSGGEKQRVAILRSFINEPEIILADEPTGALDSKNSLLVMDILKNKSQDNLVIVVTHNESLAKKYADRIIELEDGKVKSDVMLTATNKNIDDRIIKNKHGNNYINQIIKTNFIKRFKRNIISISSLIIGLTSSLLIIGFSNGAKPSLEKQIVKQVDYGVGTISKETHFSIEGSPMSIVQMSRPSINEIDQIEAMYPSFSYYPNYDFIAPSSANICYGEENLEDISYFPILSFTDSSFDHSLLMDGTIPLFDSLNEVIINKTAFNLLKEKGLSSPLNKSLLISFNKEVSYFTGSANNPYIDDYFVLQKQIKIVGVVDELSFLSSPKIYYSYKALDDYLSETILNNLSEYKRDYISWKDYIISLSNNDLVSSYSYRVFLNDYKDNNKVKELSVNLNEPFTLNSQSLTIGQALLDLVDAASIGMEIFLLIALLGTTFILGIVSFSSYMEDKKKIAILKSLGANKDDITNIYVFESVIIGTISLVLSLLFSYLIKNPINHLLSKMTSFSDLIDIPYRTFLGRNYFLIFLIVLITLLVCVLSSYLPIIFSKKISIKNELASE